VSSDKDAPAYTCQPRVEEKAEEKAEAVRLADETGSDREITRRLDLSQGAIARWRSEGFGRHMQTGSTGSPIEKVADPRTAHPSLRCPSCAAKFQIPGEATNVNRLRAWERHYEDSPECLARNLRRAQ
jgi:transposase-like protein